MAHVPRARWSARGARGLRPVRARVLLSRVGFPFYRPSCRRKRNAGSRGQGAGGLATGAAAAAGAAAGAAARRRAAGAAMAGGLPFSAQAISQEDERLLAHARRSRRGYPDAALPTRPTMQIFIKTLVRDPRARPQSVVSP